MTHYDHYFMSKALALAEKGRGYVEPNPMVGALIVRPDLEETAPASDAPQGFLPKVVGSGYHRCFGEDHAEIVAIKAAKKQAMGGTLYVTLEPCSHHGKTPPCIESIVKAGIKRVVIAHCDPFPKVAGSGIAALQGAGIEVNVGVMEDEARVLNAPYLMRVEKGRPWIIGKWAMTLDGKIATKTGSSYWVSSENSRSRLHILRSHMDAIMIGSRTAMEDDPQLTVRLPEGVPQRRTPIRIVFDSGGTLSVFSELALSAREVPLLLVFGPNTPKEKVDFWEKKGAEVLVLPLPTHEQRLILLMENLAARGVTNILVEGGGKLLGHLFDLEYLDEVYVFIAPKIVGGEEAIVPVGGIGHEFMKKATSLLDCNLEMIGTDLLVAGRLDYNKR